MKIACAKHNNQKKLYLVDGQLNYANEITGYGSTSELISAMVREADPVYQPDVGSSAPLDELSWLPPVETPEKIFCVGRNYAEHAKEMDSTIGDIPVIFNKFSSALIGSGNPIELPAVSECVDFEAELVVVMGREGRDIPQDRAMEHVFGFTCGNDVTARDWQKGKPGGQWLLGKSCDTFAPLGPWIVTAESIQNYLDLKIQLRLNGTIMQDSTTANLIFDVPFLISHLSQFVTFRPGDLIFTGTPPGVGAGRDPQVFLRPGDLIEVEIENIGTLTNRTIGNC